ncbi:MAG: type II toxin-antitoxin system RelE/ParE family toxin [Bacteroidota bacterium]
MEVEFLQSFSKDIDAVRSTDLKKKIAKIIVQVEMAERFSTLHNIKKMKGHPHAYRIRVGDYRIGLFIEDTLVQFARFAHRKEIYRLFP